MTNVSYVVQLDFDSSPVECKTLSEVYALLKEHHMVSVFCYNDKKTGEAYTKAASRCLLSVPEQERLPFFISTILSEDGYFAESEAFWMENYMVDEFYNPEQMPHIEVYKD